MKQALEVYHLELDVKGPVFVGDGNEIKKKEYVFLKNKIGVIDCGKLYTLAKKKGLERSFEEFMIKATKVSLDQWANRNNIFTSELERCMKYQEDMGDLDSKDGINVMSCMKDPYGNPYIPGSTIKGMLRTILLTKKILDDTLECTYMSREVQRELRNQEEEKRSRAYRLKRKSVLSQSMKSIEQSAYYTLERDKKNRSNAVNDWMSGIHVSDSEPLSTDDLVLCQRFEQHVDGRCRTLPILRECIKPGTKIKATVTIDRSICRLTIEEIKRAVEIFYQLYYDSFQKKFSVENDLKPSNTVFLGGGVGYISKTVTYALFSDEKAVETVQKIYDLTGVPNMHKHKEDKKLGVSPHILKCTRIKGKQYMMGQCEIMLS